MSQRMPTPIVTVASRVTGRGYLQGVFIDNVLVGWGPTERHNDLFDELVGDWSKKPYGRDETLAWLRDLNDGDTDKTYRFGDGTRW